MSVHSTNKTVYGESRNALHKELLRIFSPQLYGHLRHVELEPEYYAWDWFVQFFMGIFSYSQCCVLIDLFLSFSQTSGDFIFICLSVAILDEMRDVLMTVSKGYGVVIIRIHEWNPLSWNTFCFQCVML